MTKINDDGSVEMADGKCVINPNGTLSLSSDNFGSHVSEISSDGAITITNPAGQFAYNNGNLSVLDASQDVEVLSVTGDGRIGFFGCAPISQPAVGSATAGSTYGANERDMLQRIYNAMRSLGLAS